MTSTPKLCPEHRWFEPCKVCLALGRPREEIVVVSKISWPCLGGVVIFWSVIAGIIWAIATYPEYVGVVVAGVIGTILFGSVSFIVYQICKISRGDDDDQICH